MKGHTVSIVEGKKGFSSLIDGAIAKKEDVIVTRRGKPVAVIVPYDQYIQARRRDAWQKIIETREVFKRARINADEIARESRKELESRSCKE